MQMRMRMRIVPIRSDPAQSGATRREHPVRQNPPGGWAVVRAVFDSVPHVSILTAYTATLDQRSHVCSHSSPRGAPGRMPQAGGLGVVTGLVVWGGVSGALRHLGSYGIPPGRPTQAEPVLLLARWLPNRYRQRKIGLLYDRHSRLVAIS
jgi:hypothetical protein